MITMNLYSLFRKTFPIILVVFLPVAHISCRKGFLDAKPDQSLIIPTTLKDMQALLDNTGVHNVTPRLGEMASDDYYILTAYYNGRVLRDRNIYTWASGDIFAGDRITDWDNSYTSIYYTNTVLEGLDKIQETSSNATAWEKIKGTALFYRAYGYYNIAQLFCKPYIETSAKNDLGVILRLSTNVSEPSRRVSVQQTYDQILSDLKESCKLLPSTRTSFLTQPYKASAYAMLSRVYLSMQHYDSALYYSSESIQLHPTLLNYYNSIDTNLMYSFPRYNSEVLFHSYQSNTPLLTHNTGSGYVDSALLSLYTDPHDLRKKVFFGVLNTVTPQRPFFKGSYNGTDASTFLFSGLANDEVYLTRAECYARRGDTANALKDLNTLLQSRWRSGKHVRVIAADANDALKKILNERRKQLCFRGTRWTDLRRLNQDARFAITLKKTVGQTHLLPPNDNRYVYPIPDNEILLSGVPQNPR
jgi:starch-binding outer membrane protein, SusD/RagB family